MICMRTIAHRAEAVERRYSSRSGEVAVAGPTHGALGRCGQAEGARNVLSTRE